MAGGLVWSIGSGTLYALNAATGAEVQHFAIGASSSSFPSPSAADGLILAPSSTQIHAFVGPAGTTGPAASAAPDHERAHSFERGHGVRVDHP